MKAKRLDDGSGPKTFAVVFGHEEEVMAGLLAVAQQNGLQASQLTAIGGFSRATLGYFDRAKKDYIKIPVGEQVEVLSLVGDIAMNGEKPQIHAHVVVGKRDGTTLGGHIMEAYAWPTLEVVIVESPQHLQRKTDPESGLALIVL